MPPGKGRGIRQGGRGRGRGRAKATGKIFGNKLTLKKIHTSDSSDDDFSLKPSAKKKKLKPIDTSSSESSDVEMPKQSSVDTKKDNLKFNIVEKKENDLQNAQNLPVESINENLEVEVEKQVDNLQNANVEQEQVLPQDDEASGRSIDVEGQRDVQAQLVMHERVLMTSDEVDKYYARNQCPICLRTYKLAQSWTTHLSQTIVGEDCGLCCHDEKCQAPPFNSLRALTDHNKEVHDVELKKDKATTSKCHKCDFVSTTGLKEMLKHILTVHGLNLRMRMNDDVKGNHFVTCHFCLDSVQEIMLSSHFYSCHSENLELLCEICFKVYKGKSELFPSKTALLIHRNKNPRNHPQHRQGCFEMTKCKHCKEEFKHAKGTLNLVNHMIWEHSLPQKNARLSIQKAAELMQEDASLYGPNFDSFRPMTPARLDTGEFFVTEGAQAAAKALLAECYRTINTNEVQFDVRYCEDNNHMILSNFNEVCNDVLSQKPKVVVSQLVECLQDHAGALDYIESITYRESQLLLKLSPKALVQLLGYACEESRPCAEKRVSVIFGPANSIQSITGKFGFDLLQSEVICKRMQSTGYLVTGIVCCLIAADDDKTVNTVNQILDSEQGDVIMTPKAYLNEHIDKKLVELLAMGIVSQKSASLMMHLNTTPLAITLRDKNGVLTNEALILHTILHELSKSSSDELWVQRHFEPLIDAMVKSGIEFGKVDVHFYDGSTANTFGFEFEMPKVTSLASLSWNNVVKAFTPHIKASILTKMPQRAFGIDSGGGSKNILRDLISLLKFNVAFNKTDNILVDHFASCQDPTSPFYVLNSFSRVDEVYMILEDRFKVHGHARFTAKCDFKKANHHELAMITLKVNECLHKENCTDESFYALLVQFSKCIKHAYNYPERPIDETSKRDDWSFDDFDVERIVLFKCVSMVLGKVLALCGATVFSEMFK